MRSVSTKPACARWRRPVKEDPFGWGPGRWSWLDVMLEWQRGQCALCGHSPYGSRMALDHSHATGLVRGYLCTACNCHYADYNDSYVGGSNPAAILGLVGIYRDPLGWPVMRGDPATVGACFTLAGLAFDALPSRQRTDFTEDELTGARDLLWAVEGWPIPAEWRWEKPALTGQRWSPPPPTEPGFWDSLLSRLSATAPRQVEPGSVAGLSGDSQSPLPDDPRPE